MKVVLIIAALVAAAVAQTGNECNQQACPGTSCTSGRTCCSGTCWPSIYPGTQLLGAACTAGAICTDCLVGTCTSSKCQLSGYGYACASGCSTDAQCAGNAGFGQKCVSGVCVEVNLGVGATCDTTSRFCHGALTCSGNPGTCGNLAAVGARCERLWTGNPVPAGARDGSNCTSAAFCNVTGGTGIGGLTSVCTNLIAASGTTCTSSAECVVGTWCQTAGPLNMPLGTCLARGGIPNWSPCTAGADWQCASGSFCSMFNSTFYACMTGSRHGAATGAACFNDDSCMLGANCTNNGWYASNPGALQWGTCSAQSIGQVCDPLLNSPSTCITRGPASYVSTSTPPVTWSYGCACTGSAGAMSYKCAVTSSPDQSSPCASMITSTAAAMAKYGANGVAGALNEGTTGTNSADAQSVASYMCCSACRDSISYPGGLTSPLLASFLMYFAQSVKFSISCSTTNGAVLATANADFNTARCAGTASGGFVGVTVASFFGSCPAASSGSSSVVPSVALLVAIVAAFLALFM